MWRVWRSGKTIGVSRWPCFPSSPVGGPVVAVVGQKVEVELPEDVEGDAPIGRGHVVVGLTEHGIEAVQSHVLAQQPVSQAIDFQEPLQLLQHIKQQKMQRITTETDDLIVKGMVFYPHACRTKDIDLSQRPRPIAFPLRGVLVQYFVNLQEAKLICSPLSTGWLSPQNPPKVETGNFTLLNSDAPVTYQRQQTL